MQHIMTAGVEKSRPIARTLKGHQSRQSLH